MAVRPYANGPMEADDPIGFEELWEHRWRVHAVCQGFGGDPRTVEDLVQDTYLRALTTSRPPDRRGPIAAWLTTVARHRAIDERRAARRVQPEALERTTAVSEGADPAEQFLRSERRARVRQALDGLGTQERSLLVRHVVHGLSINELAAEKYMSEASVRSVLWRARRKLRAALDRGGPLGTAPLPRWDAPWRRLREWRTRLEAHAVPLLPSMGVQLVEAMVVLASVLLLTAASSPSKVDPAGLSVAGVDGVEVAVPGPSTRPTAARVGGDLEAEGLRSWAQTEVRTETPGGRMEFGTDAGAMSTDVVVEFEPTYVGVGFRVDLPEPLPDLSKRYTVSCDDDSIIMNECPTMATLAEATEEMQG